MVRFDNRGVILFVFVIAANILYSFIWHYLKDIYSAAAVFLLINLFAAVIFCLYLKRWSLKHLAFTWSSIYKKQSNKQAKKQKKKQKQFAKPLIPPSDSRSIVFTSAILFFAFVLLAALVLLPFSEISAFLLFIRGTVIVVASTAVSYLIIRYLR